MKKFWAAAGVMALALMHPVSAYAQVDNLNDRREATDKEREQVIQQLVKTHFIERADVHGGHSNVYVGYEFYNPHLVRSEQARYIRIIAGYLGKAELDYWTPLFDGQIGIRIGEFKRKTGLVLKLPPPLANRPHRQPPPVVPEKLPRDEDQLLELIVNWFDSAVLWKYDDSEPDRPTLYVGGATFFDGIFDHQQRKTILETAGSYYARMGGSLLFKDNETDVQFGTYTKGKGLVLAPPPAFANHFRIHAPLSPYQKASQTKKLDVPVMVGVHGPQLSACASSGEIMGLDPRGDGYLSVRSGPGGKPFKEVDRLFNGMAVFVCDHKGDWLGIVYKPSNLLEMDCNVMTSWSTAQAYTGPCRVGWVHRRYVRLVAG